jgi:hypothetical protein
MIPHGEILALRGEWNLRADVIEKDYMLGWMLAAIASTTDLSETWIFKGARVYASASTRHTGSPRTSTSRLSMAGRKLPKTFGRSSKAWARCSTIEPAWR